MFNTHKKYRISAIILIGLFFGGCAIQQSRVDVKQQEDLGLSNDVNTPISDANESNTNKTEEVAPVIADTYFCVADDECIIELRYTVERAEKGRYDCCRGCSQLTIDMASVERIAVNKSIFDQKDEYCREQMCPLCAAPKPIILNDIYKAVCLESRCTKALR